jgi:hypothetical protein
MKHFVQLLSAIFIIGLLLVTGCDQQMMDNPVSPEQTGPVSSGPQFLNLSEMVDMQAGFAKPVEISQTIDPARGGTLRYTQSGKSKSGGAWSIDWKLTIPPYALTKSTKITALVNFDTLGSTISNNLSPSLLSFKVPATLDITIVGLDTVKYGSWRWGTGQLSFWYFNQATSLWEPMSAQSVTADAATRTFRAVRCQVPHFSKYAFAR